MAFSLQPSLRSDPGTFSSPPKRNPVPRSRPPPPAPGIYSCTFCLFILPYSGCFPSMESPVCDPLGPVFFHLRSVCKVPPCLLASVSFISNIPFYGQIKFQRMDDIIFCLSVYPPMDVWEVSTFLVGVNKVAGNIRIQVVV